MNMDEHDELWELLGKAKKTEVSPFFARNVLRQVRNQKTVANRFRGWLPRFALLTALFLLGAGVATLSMPHKPVVQQSKLAATPDFETLNHLDELLAYEENSTWLESY